MSHSGDHSFYYDPFVCDDCENAKPIYRDRLCRECWMEWQAYMDSLAADTDSSSMKPETK